VRLPERSPTAHWAKRAYTHHHHHHHHLNRWVWAHWAEKGTWSGESCGVAPLGTPLDVSGQTRFLLEERGAEQKIIQQVVYRTFSDWENALH
jgi:hypothetical protein